MTRRVVAYNEVNTTAATTSTTNGDFIGCGCGWTGAASTDYLVLWTGTITHSATTSDDRVTLYNQVAAAALCTINVEVQDTSDVIPVMGMARIQVAGSPVDQFVSLRHSAEAGTSTLGYGRIAVLKLSSDDKFAESTGQSDTTSGTLGDKIELAWTPASSRDYLIIATAEIGNAAVSNCEVQLHNGTTAYGYSDPCPNKDTANWVPWGTMVKATLSGAQSWKIRFASANAVNNGSIRNARIIALDLTGFEGSSYTESRSRDTTTSTSQQTKVTNAPTVERGFHLALACALLDGSSATISTRADFQRGGVTESVEDIHEAPATTIERPFFQIRGIPLAASTPSWTVKYRSETASVTTGISEAAAASLDCGGAWFGRIAASSDDAGEATDNVDINTVSLYICTYPGLGSLTVGLRWDGVEIPDTCTIDGAWIQVQSFEDQSGTTANVDIYGEDVDDAATYTAGAGDLLDNRTKTSAVVGWDAIAAWTTEEISLDTRTPDIKTVIQEIVDRAGWVATNAISIIIPDAASTADVARAFSAWDNATGDAPTLFIEYTEAAAAVNITPPQGNLALSTTAPAVVQTTNVAAAPAADDLVLSATAPAVVQTTNENELPAAGNLVLTGTAPTVVQTTTENELPGQGNLVLTGTAPTVAINLPLEPARVDLTLSGTAPLLHINLTLEPARADLTLSMTAPTVVQTTSEDESPATADLVLSTTAPGVSVSTTTDFAPARADLALSGTAPTVDQTATVDLTPARADLLITANPPMVSVSVPVQTGAPISDISAGTWRASAGTDLYAMLDEVVVDDADYDRSAANPSSDVMEVRLTAMTPPVAGTHTIRYRYGKSAPEGVLNLQVDLVVDTTVIATWTHNDISATLATAEQTLSAGEIAAITDYSNLRLRFTANEP